MGMTVAVPAFKQGADGEIWPVAYGEVYTPDATGPGAILKVPLGTITRMRDSELGVGDFIFLKGVASCAIGSVVEYQSTVTTSTAPTYVSTLHVPANSSGKILAIATGAIGASAYGWFQISGNAQVLSNGTISGAQALLYLVGTGTCSTTATAQRQMLGAFCVSALGVPSGNLIIAQLNRPMAQGPIT